jgi:hypothetical protein
MSTDLVIDRICQLVSNSPKMFLGASLTIVAMLGCSSKPAYPGAHLSGEVSIDGNPVQDGSIVFTPTGGAHGQTVGTQIRAGRYDCPYVPMGDSLVQIYALRPTGKMVEIMGSMKPEMQDLVPPKVRDGIRIKIEGDNSNQDFSLKS